MNRKEIFQEVQEILVVSLAVSKDKIPSESTILGDIGADSLDFPMISKGLWERFNIEDDIPKNTETVGQIVTFVEEQLQVKENV